MANKTQFSKDLDQLLLDAALMGAEYAFKMAEAGHNLQHIQAELTKIVKGEN